MRTKAVAQKIRHELSDAKIERGGALDAAVRRWLEADGDFNLWFLETTKGALADSALLALVEGYGGDQDDVERAWDDFRDLGGEPAALVEVLERSMQRMAKLKEK
jgi:hypothetical protein